MRYKLILILFLLAHQSRAQPLSGYFDSYEENKSAFKALALKHLIESWPLTSNKNLTTDLALYSSKKDSLIVISSGLHGIEGFVGAAVQQNLMTSIEQKKDLKSDVLFIHALNPWGMKYKRRVNENNVDLNRNFSISPELYNKKNNDYLKISSFLNPSTTVQISFLHRLRFLIDSALLIFDNGLEPLRKSILLGQFSERKGLYFGGNRNEELQAHIDDLFEKRLTDYKTILWIDLHTGYGKRGHLHLLANDFSSEPGQKLGVIFSQQKIDFGDQKNFYKTDGDLVSYLIAKSSKVQQVLAITFEYGTMDSQKPLGSIESLRRMIIENQGYQYGYKDAATKAEGQKLFADMFFPQEEGWKSEILQQTQKLINPVLETTK